MSSTSTDRINGLSTSVAVKAPVKAVSSANLTLSGEQTVGGVALVDGDRVLVKDQSTPSQNGIYVVSSGSWTRAKDFDGNRDVVKGTLVVTDGVSTALLFYRVTTADPIVIGTSNIVFVQASEIQDPYPRSAAEIAASVTPTDTSLPSDDFEDPSLLRFGGVGDNSTSNNTAVTNADAVADQTGGFIYVPAGIYKTTLTSLDLHKFYGPGQILINSTEDADGVAKWLCKKANAAANSVQTGRIEMRQFPSLNANQNNFTFSAGAQSGTYYPNVRIQVDDITAHVGINLGGTDFSQFTVENVGGYAQFQLRGINYQNQSNATEYFVAQMRDNGMTMKAHRGDYVFATASGQFEFNPDSKTNSAFVFDVDGSSNGTIVMRGGNYTTGVNATEYIRMTVDVNGIRFLKGVTTEAVRIAGFASGGETGSADSVTINSGNSVGYNAAATVIRCNMNSSTSRSINAAGTINASGADYAEYERKRDDCGPIAKGDVVGFDENGLITDRWALAVTFGIKSSDPSYVGGDTWGRDLEGDALEAARQKVDRIAYCGKVPVNVYNAKPGDYIIAAELGGGIAGMISKRRHDGYTVGRVRRILKDGRAEVVVL